MWAEPDFSDEVDVVDWSEKFAPHQWQILAWDFDDDGKPIPEMALAGGVGAGKSFTAVRWLWDRSRRNPPGLQCCIVEPTYTMLEDVIVPLFEDMFDELGVENSLNQTKMVWTWAEPNGDERYILLRSGDKPKRLSGLNLACANIDEAAHQDSEVDRIIGDRLRNTSSTLRQVLYTSTHEGTGNWFYRKTLTIRTVIAPSMDNKNLPLDYLERLARKYGGPEDPRYRMYVLGEAVELSGGIYTNLGNANLRTCDDPRGQIVLGWDFNVHWMVTTVGTWRNGVLHLWGEVVTKGGTTTDEHAERVYRYLEDRGVASRDIRGVVRDATGEQVEACVDASGDRSTSNASKSDHRHVRDAGFWPRAQASNPFVRDRIATVQAALRERRLLIDPDGAPLTYQSLKEHAYEEGTQKPRKHWGEDDVQLDHACDAVGYMMWQLAPMRSVPSVPRGRPEQRGLQWKSTASMGR